MCALASHRGRPSPGEPAHGFPVTMPHRPPGASLFHWEANPRPCWSSSLLQTLWGLSPHSSRLRTGSLSLPGPAGRSAFTFSSSGVAFWGAMGRGGVAEAHLPSPPALAGFTPLSRTSTAPGILSPRCSCLSGTPLSPGITPCLPAMTSRSRWDSITRTATSRWS